MSLADRDNPLLFKRDGSMDLSQFLLVLLTVWVCVVWVLAGLAVLRVSTAAWAFLGSFTTLAFIAWAARDRAELIANSKAPGEVAAGVAKVRDTPQDAETFIVRHDE